MKTLLSSVLCVPLVLAATGSHVQVSIGGSTYSHGNKVGLPEPVYHAAPAPAPAPAPHHMPMKDNMAMDSMMEGMMDGMEEGMMGDMMDGMMEDMPKHAPAPFYHVTPAPAYHVTPSYHAHPAPAHAPVYHSKLAWGAGHAPAPVYHHPAPVVHHAPAYHHPAPAYHHAPKHNCSVVSVMEKVEVCTPALETKCMPVELMVKRVVEVEQCQEVTRTVCTESTELVANEVCTYSYMAHTQDSTATTVEVTFKKECMAQMVTVCQPGPGYGYHSYGHQYCKEVSQETCYNVPVVTPLEVAVMLTFPQPMRECMDKPISLPRVTCEDITERKCISVPELMEDTEVVDKCETVEAAAPSCTMLELELPKQVCKELVYGAAYDHRV